MSSLILSKNIKSNFGQELRSALGDDMWVTISRAYLATIVGLEEDLSFSIQNGALDDLHALGHKFKSSSALVGAEELAEQFRQLETVENLEEAQILIESLIECFVETRTVLQKVS